MISGKTEVLIVGAGPVGLTAALSLAQTGAAFRIIDRLPQAVNQSRAAIIHARTLEYFARIGIVDDFLAVGVKVHGAAIYGADNTLLVRPSFDHLPSPYPFLLGLEQSATEAILTRQLKNAGGEVERGVELLGFFDSGNTVSARLRHPDGTETTEEFSYLLGCDGAHSAVRAGLGLKLEGETLDAIWITADVRIRWGRDSDEAIAYLSDVGIVFIAPMNSGRWRVILNLPGPTREEAEKYTIEDIQQVICERFDLAVEFYDCVWISVFGINTRMAPTMGRDRVFLCGDAAHVHSPVGGQGMNTGIQDAENLTWKLTLVLRGLARPELLGSYDAERHANAKRLLARVGTATKMANLRHPVAIGVRNQVIRLVGHLGMAKIMPQIVSMLDVGYPESPAVGESPSSRHHRGPRPGERAPDAAGLLCAEHHEPRHLFDLWQGASRHHLLVFGSEEIYAPSPLYHITQIVQDGIPSENIVVDADGAACTAYEARPGACYLVRPDGIIAFRSSEPDPAALAAYLGKWYLPG